MKNLKIKMLLIVCSILITTIVGCKKDEEIITPITPASSKVFITNEGIFQSGTGTISVFDRKNLTVENNVFEKVNNKVLGNIAQSVTVFNDKAYIIVNNANKIEVINSDDYVSIATIENVILPRFFIGVSKDKAYVSSWDNAVAVVDLNTNTVTKTISTGTGPERMLFTAGKVFVLNQGGFGIDSTITVIDTQTDQIVKTINVNNKPTGICLDENGKIWVLCTGKGWNGYPQADDTEGHLICINANDYTIEKNFAFPVITEHPENLVINKEKNVLFYKYPGGVNSFDISSMSLTLTQLIKRSNGIYGLGFDNSAEYIYCTNPLDYIQDGWFLRFDANTGNVVDSFKVGIIPGEFYFD